MNNRLKQFLSVENISQSVFAERMQIAKASVSHILSGRNKPGYDFVENIARLYPALNIEWLITGKGRMYKTESDTLFTEESIIQQPKPELIVNNNRQIEKVVIFYSDNSYQEIK